MKYLIKVKLTIDRGYKASFYCSKQEVLSDECFLNLLEKLPKVIKSRYDKENLEVYFVAEGGDTKRDYIDYIYYVVEYDD